MDNLQIIAALLELADGLEMLDDNPFKVRAYRKAARSIEALDMPVSELVEKGELSRIDGVGKAIADKIEAWVVRGDFSALEDVRSRIPRGVNELLKVPGLGIKRVRMLHEQLGIDTLEDLLDACRQGKLEKIRGLSSKRISGIETAAVQVMGYRGRYLVDTSLGYAGEILDRLHGSGLHAELTGECRRTMEVITSVDIVVERTPEAAELIRECFPGARMEGDRRVVLAGPDREKPPVCLHLAEQEDYALALFFTTGSAEHVERMRRHALNAGYSLCHTGMYRGDERVGILDEHDIYRVIGRPFIPPEIREDAAAVYYERENDIPGLIEDDHLRGTIHNHTTFSDGKTPLKELVLAAHEMGYAWIGISDHSMSARYAGGMSIDDIKRQHRQIDELNRDIEGITILKGVESDILPDGSLDYPDEVLGEFDFVIASIHTHMDMAKDPMTERIVRALKNPYTSILGHPTGRLLLSREPYSVDLEAVLAEAVKNHVAVELNANPMRLDIDWRLIPGFIRAGGTISIGPDAHTARGLHDMRYGVMMARKGLLTPDACLNTYGLAEIRKVLSRKGKADS